MDHGRLIILNEHSFSKRPAVYEAFAPLVENKKSQDAPGWAESRQIIMRGALGAIEARWIRVGDAGP